MSTMSAPPPMMFLNASPPPQRPWLSWGFSLAMALLAAWSTGMLPKLPTLPQVPTIPQPPTPPVVPPVVPPNPPLLPPILPPVPPSAPRPDTLGAIGRIQFGNSGCTATIIGPRRADGRYDVLTAAHCVREKGQHGSMRLRDGRSLGIVVASIDQRADVCWCVTQTNSDVYPHALLADATPAVGSQVWHAGYGVHVPGNREDGTVEAGPDQNGQVRYRLSVSSGDSGGGICMTADGAVLSPVCCTTARGQTGQVWGGSPEAARRAKPPALVYDEWLPLEIPMRMEDQPGR